MGNCSATQMICVDVYKCPRVQVLRPDGRIEQYRYPTDVSFVMRMHPAHMLLHCSSLDLPVGPHSKITIMRPDQELVPGQSYLIYPIPHEFQTTMFKAFCRRASVPMEGTTQRAAKKLKKLRGTRAVRLTDLTQLCTKLLLQTLQPMGPTSSNYVIRNLGSAFAASCRGSGTRTIEAAPYAPRLDSRTCVDHTNSAFYSGASCKILCDSPYKSRLLFEGWKPALESIPESPSRPSLPCDFEFQIFQPTARSFRTLDRPSSTPILPRLYTPEHTTYRESSAGSVLDPF